MKACNKCRCADVCAIKGEYDVEYTNAQNAYNPKGAAFEVTIRCNRYIPETRRKSNEQHKSYWR
jgi:hypothetical protein